MKTSHILLILATSVGFYACDKIEEGKYKQNSSPTGIPDTNIVHVKKVLLEDYTGHTCGNCPKAAEIAHSIAVSKPGRVVIISVHAGGFALPMPGKYSYDFRTPAGTALDNFFGISAGAGNPNGMVNRVGETNNKIKGQGAWAGLVDTLLTSTLHMDIKVDNIFVEATKTVTSTINAESLSNYPNPIKLVVVVTEDSIKSYQTDYRKNPPDIPDYYHREVLRTSITPTFGDTLGNGAPGLGKKFKKVYTYALNSNWSAKHCRIVAYIYDATTLEVLQVEEKKIQ